MKRPLFALEPLRRLRRDGEPVYFVIAGPPMDASVTQSVIEAQRAEPWLRWLGAVPHERMGALYQSCDIVLNTSTAEGLSNAVLEAMASRKPIIASRNDGNVAALGETALLFDDEEGLYRCASSLAAQPLLRRKLADEALERGSRLFTRSHEADAYTRLYRSILEPSQAQSCGGDR